MAEKKYKLFHIPLLSLFSKELYKDVGENWRGSGLLYLLFLMMVCFVPAIIVMQVTINNFAANEATQIIEQVPKITIAKGELSISEPQPYTITNPATDEPILVIDTTGTVVDLDQTKALGLLTKDRATIQKSSGERRSYLFSEMESDLVITKDKIRHWLGLARKFAPLIIYPFVVLVFFIIKVIQILILSVIGLIFVKSLKRNLSYTAILRLATVAITPFVILETIASLLEITIPLATLLFFVGAAGYLFFGVKSCEPQNQEQSSGDGAPNSR